MAHVSKYSRGQAVGLTRHYKRHQNENGEYMRFGNQQIDTDKTHLNYNIAPEQNQLDFIKQRTSEVQCMKRVDVNVMCSWVVTAPESVQSDPERKKYFFQETYNFLSNKYGAGNIVSAYVHQDESSPHIHFAFIPITVDQKKQIEKVSAKEVLTKVHLKTFHGELEQHMGRVFGQEIGILNGATEKGNLTVTELKQKSAHQDLQNAQKQLEVLSSNIEVLQKEEKALIDGIEGVITEERLLWAMKPYKTLTGSIKGISLEDIEYLKEKTQQVHSALLENKELQKEIEHLKWHLPTLEDKLEQSNLVQTNRNLRQELLEANKFLFSIPQELRDELVNAHNNHMEQNQHNQNYDQEHDLDMEL